MFMPKGNAFKKIIVLMSLILLVSLYALFSYKEDSEITIHTINSIEELNVSKFYHKDSYLLIYPADARINQPQTIIKQVSTTGDITNEYRVEDDSFRRIDAHQKPSNHETVFFSNFGAPIIGNYFYTYDLINKRFKKNDITYFSFPVGVDNMLHYGVDTLFLTLNSHKTGDQAFNEELESFKLSISDFTTQKSYESEWGYVPGAYPLLQVNNKIFFTALGRYDTPSCLGIIDKETSQITYTKLESESASLYTLYSDATKAYILDSAGKMYTIDKNLNYTMSYPFSNYDSENYIYCLDDGYIVLEDNLMLVQIWNCKSDTFIMGTLEFGDTPHFTQLKQDYLEDDVFLKILSFDPISNEIYLVQMKDDNSNLIIIDSKTLNLKENIPIQYPHLLDFVIKAG